MPTHFDELNIDDVPASYGYCYILACADNSLYVGSTRDLKLRLAQHKTCEGAKHTAEHLPVTLIYYECFPRIDTAFYREQQIKKWSRKKKITLIRGKYAQLRFLALREDQVGLLSTKNKR